MITEFGLWWKYQHSNETRKILISNRQQGGDFTREEAEIIGPQVKERVFESRYWSKYQHPLVKVNNNLFYVLVDSGGSIKLPRNKESERIRTTDKTLIPSFKESLPKP